VRAELWSAAGAPAAGAAPWLPEEPRLEWESGGSTLVGLLRLLDPAGERHSYAAGAPDGEDGRVVVGELGALRRAAAPGAIPLWLDDAGRATTDTYAPPLPTPSTTARLRWAAAPIGWRGDLAATTRVSLSLARGRLLLQRRDAPNPPAGAASAAPAGYLDERAGPGTLPLYSALHPVTGDQLLTTNDWEPGDLGYLEPALLGHVVLAAHVTGRVGAGRPPLRWASRLGQRVRGDSGPHGVAPGGGFDRPGSRFASTASRPGVRASASRVPTCPRTAPIRRRWSAGSNSCCPAPAWRPVRSAPS
jgi:hypothetical protein